MKTNKILAFLTIGFLLIACNEQTKSKNKTIEQSISKIEVLDFHSTHRCITCKAIEANTKYTLDTYFSKEIKASKITFQVIDVDKKENQTMAEKFEASGTALILNVIKNGKEKKIDLTNFAFMKGNDKDVFAKQLKEKIDKELKTL
ncbi:nitrophenyl compound nitroreductase subunit ArsF family protein [Polaribacter butkevichii]|uniref:Thioredoxin domain-containing protein n=1 Tax=Polaribacter butkevichii TaxID=218490 RepID=A0A2P6CD83_9FLAO|nr:nitrophenyl compound nitroreductase subunit ArsF family protein [Polaribacter butkevichii]PQJ72818.1 hypothetical protein BTO14_05895 [Polaribacter butkevichii]